MTEIDFHFNASDKVRHTCRLVRKAVGRGARVVIVADEELLTQLNMALWQLSAVDFIAHCRDNAAPEVLARSPVVLASDGRAVALPHLQVLVHLGRTVPDGFERFERLIEIVSEQEDDRQAGRIRWRHYATRGYMLKREDLRADVANAAISSHASAAPAGHEGDA